jgi:hypothetical protein
MIKTLITDGANGKYACIDKKDNDPNGVVTYSRDLYSVEQSLHFASNDTYGINMNIDATAGGTPLNIHNGGDNTYWTATALSGTWDFASTTVANNGTRSVDATGTVNNDEAEFSDSATDLSNYVSLTGYIYITGWPTSGSVKEVEIELRNAGVLQGNLVNMSSYVNTGTFNSWQQFTIPLDDFGAATATIDELVFRTRDVGGGAPPDYYLDDIQFQETGEPVVFDITAPFDYGFIDTATFVLADNIASTVTNGTIPGLAYDSFLGVSPSNGFILQNIRNDRVNFSGALFGIGDFMGISNFNITSAVSDGTNTFIKLELRLSRPIPFNKKDGDILRVILSDDYSGLLRMRYSVRVWQVVGKE